MKNSGRLGVAPVQIGSSHVTLILSAPHRPDTLTLGDARVAVLARPFSMGHEDGGEEFNVPVGGHVVMDSNSCMESRKKRKPKNTY